MAKRYLILILLVLLIAGPTGNLVTAKTKSNTIQLTKQPTQQKTDIFKELTAQDRKNYVLIIDQSKIGKPHDTILYNGKFKAFNVPVILSNLSNDRLRYLSMSCSWEDFFSINNKKLNIAGNECDKNVFENKIVLPHKSVTYNMPVLTDGTVRDDKFSVGMNLFIINKQNKNFSLDFPWPEYGTKNLIWSNKVMIP